MADDKNPQKKKPSQSQNVMRASTGRERLHDMATDLLESISAQPLARISDALGMSGFKGMKEDMANPNAGVKQGIMPGLPGRGALSNIAPKRSNLGHEMYMPNNLLSETELARRNAFTEQNAAMDAALSRIGRPQSSPVAQKFGARPEIPNARQMQGAPPEFQQVNPNKYTVDPNEMPQGKMEYLDPDVAAYMNPEPMDVTTRQGQEKLKLMLGRR